MNGWMTLNIILSLIIERNYPNRMATVNSQLSRAFAIAFNLLYSYYCYVHIK